MSAFYDNMAELARAKIADFGRAITITRVIGNQFSNYDPSTGEAASAENTYSATALVFPYDRRRVDGALIRAEDMVITIDAKSCPVVPDQTTDRITVGSVQYSIVSVRELNPGGTAILYEVQGRVNS